ncbi:MAG: hypothetical protein P8L44_05695 [Opitutales bacterium]|nr:hypothetical protein [Opitutales bacterium]
MNTKLEELASLYVLDELNYQERVAFEQQLETNTELLMLVKELELTFEDQIRNLPQSAAPERVFDSIQQKIGPATQGTLTKPVITISWSTFAGWGMAAALLLGVGLTLLLTNRGSDPLATPNQPVVLLVGMDSKSAFVEAIPSQMPVDELENFVQLAEMAETFWKHPERLPAKVQSPLANTKSSGYAVYDPQGRHGFIAIQKLPVQEEGKNYTLWLKDLGSNVLERAGIIPMQDKDQGLYFFELDEGSTLSSNQVAFFITEEETTETELQQPQGELVLGSDHI